MPPELKGQLDLLLLAILADAPAHGYALVAQLRERSGGEFTAGEGAVYPVLYKLAADGLIASAWETSDGRRRCVYRITRSGRGVLRRQTSEWRRFVGGMEAVLGGSA